MDVRSEDRGETPLHAAAAKGECAAMKALLKAGAEVDAKYLLLLYFQLSGLELSDTQVYEPEIRALLGTGSHFCEVVA